MSGLIAIEGELNSAIQEYLEYNGFESTLEKFNEECFSKGKTIINVERKQKINQKSNLILNEMVQLFCHGERKEFFRRWLQNIPANLINDNVDAKKLEFELNIYFAIYPLKKSGKESRIQYEESIASFKVFIETRGRVLSQNVEFLPYFALPFVPNVRENPGYQHIFSDDWSTELQKKLEDFLSGALKIQQQPRLVSVYSNSTSNVINTNYQQQLLESEKRTMAYMKKFNKVQADYHNLIGITAELVDSLENTIRGQPVTSEYLQNICNRLFNSQLKQSIDFTRPGTAGDYIRQSLAYQKSNLEKEKSYILLDFHKLKHDLKNSTERLKALLLQALRWRLTKTQPGEQRDKILDSYIANDLFSIKSDNENNCIINMLKSNDEAVKQYMARILNAFASLNKGRSYLASNTNSIKIMEDVLRSEKEDTLCKQNLLAALQKLSLRRNLQTMMINDNITSWLLDLLEDTETLSDYTLEYAVALLMNLCLRNAGKLKCTQDYKKTIQVLSDLLGNSNHEIRPYVNGALYSVLSMPTIRAYAKKIDLETTLKTYLNDGNEEINTQIQFIINQINSNQDSELNESDNENEDNDDDEEDQDAMETDLDKTEIIKANSNELFGEALLLQNYSGNNKNQKQKINIVNLESSVLSRPTTPHQLRQSVQSINTKSLSLIKKNDKNIDSIKSNIFHSESIDINDDLKIKQKSLLNLKESSMTNSKNSGIVNKSQIRLKSNNNYKKPTEQIIKLIHDNSFERSVYKNETGKKNLNEQSTLTLNSVSTVNASSTIINPKYSSMEPRPSSANSSKSRNSSSSGTTFYELNQKKDISKVT